MFHSAGFIVRSVVLEDTDFGFGVPEFLGGLDLERIVKGAGHTVYGVGYEAYGVRRRVQGVWCKSVGCRSVRVRMRVARLTIVGLECWVESAATHRGRGCRAGASD